MKKKDNEDKKKITLKERISLNFRKNWIVSRSITILIVLILFVAYICINLWAKGADLPEIDVTENKIYTLSDSSKDAIAGLEEEVTIYAYGFEEDGSLIKLLKQYTEVNDKIKYEILTEETNYSMIQEHDLKEGYYVLILKSNNAEKIIDGSQDFTSYDNTTGQSIDTTEQVITNSILALNEKNKPKVYFVQGHGEFELAEVNVFTTYLKNEAFDVDTLNIATTGSIPDDCSILAILSPTSDFFENEAEAVKNYINKGGNIYFTQDVVSGDTSFANLQSILDLYGVSVSNGYVVEYAENKALAEYPYIFMPQISSSNKITRDIYSDGRMWLVYSAKLDFKDEATLESLKVTKETLLSSSDDAIFVTDLGSNIENALQTATSGSSEISSLVTKTIDTTNENGEATTVESNMVIVASGSFISDYPVSALSQSYPLSYLESNKDFAINAMSYLGDKEYIITIRKDMANSTYLPTEKQNRIVTSIVYGVPVIIIMTGILIGVYRKKRR